jgi:hypothetical protein
MPNINCRRFIRKGKIAATGMITVKVKADGAVSTFKIRADNKNLMDIVLTTKENKDVAWEIECDTL